MADEFGQEDRPTKGDALDAASFEHPETDDDLVADPEGVEDPSVLTRLYISRFARRLIRRAAVVVLLISVLTGIGLYRAETAADRAEEAAGTATETAESVGQEEVDRQVSTCQTTNEFRLLYRQDLARRSEPLPIEEIRQTPEFRALPPDAVPFVEFFLAELVEAREAAAEVLGDYTSEFPIVDCELLRTELESAPR